MIAGELVLAQTSAGTSSRLASGASSIKAVHRT